MSLRLSTSSSRKAYRKCARYYKLAYVDQWKAVRVSDALHVGTGVHVGLESWWLADKSPAVAAVHAVTGRGRDGYEQARMDAMLIGYSEHWSFDRRNFDVIGAEVPFEGPVLDPDGDDVSPDWRMSGKIDALARDRRSGDVWVIEHKTTSENIEGDDADYWLKLGMDDQCSAYAVGAEFLGHDARHVLYDVIKKPTMRPKVATPIEKRRFKKRTKAQVAKGWPEDDPRLYYAGTRLEDETPEEYFDRIMVDIRNRPDHYYQRKLIPRTDWQVREFLRDVWAITKQIDHSERESAYPRNPDACSQYGRCQFFDVCSLGVDPAEHPDRFEKKTSAHEELEEEKEDDGSNWFDEFDSPRQEAHAG